MTAKLRVERFGVCVIRRSGAGFTTNRPEFSEPTENGKIDPNIGFLQEMLGPASGEQSEAKGATTKLIVTNPSSDELAGNFPGTLNPHADGTHLASQPPLMILQYLTSADVGGALRFVDMAGIFEALFYKDAEHFEDMVREFQRCDAVSVVKRFPDGNTVTHEAPFLFRTAYASVNSLGCRGRFDAKVTPHAAVKPYFEEVSRMVLSEKFRVSFSPLPSDIVLLDNWRVVHGRGHYATLGPRAHRRLWIESLYPTVQANLLLGLRPLLALTQKAGETPIKKPANPVVTGLEKNVNPEQQGRITPTGEGGQDEVTREASPAVASGQEVLPSVRSAVWLVLECLHRRLKGYGGKEARISLVAEIGKSLPSEEAAIAIEHAVGLHLIARSTSNLVSFTQKGINQHLQSIASKLFQNSNIND